MNRKLRVDFSNDNPEESDNSNSNPSFQPPSFPPVLGMPPQNGYSAPPPNPNSSLPPLPLGIDLPDGLSCPDAISRTLQTLPTPQLLEVLTQMKTLATNNPGKATELLNQAPQLSYAIFQALLLMDLVSNDTLSSVLAEATNVPPSLPTPAQQPQYPAPPAGQFAPQGYPPQMGTPPVRSTPGAYPPPPIPQAQVQQPTPVPQPAAAAPPDTDALIQQVLAMPQEVIDSLAPNERAQIMAIRAQYGR
jgi:cleavage stimulation factor subunit 2